MARRPPIATKTRPEDRERAPHSVAADHPTPGGRPIRTILAVALGLLVGVVAAVLVPRLLDSDDATAPASDLASEGSEAERRTLDDDDVVTGPADLLDEDAPIPPGAGATSAEAALVGFLDAEADRDFETSFGFLSAADRQEYGSAAFWVASHANVVAPVVSYELGAASETADFTAVETTVRFEPGLDQVVGLTPAEALVTWAVSEGPDGTWGVSLGASAIVPSYPPDGGAADAARSWVDARQACEEPTNERQGLIGSAAIATTLCDAEGELRIGEVERLDDAAGAAVNTAFGSEAANAARLVRVEGSVELGALLAPIGDEWIVIGVLP